MRALFESAPLHELTKCPDRQEFTIRSVCIVAPSGPVLNMRKKTIWLRVVKLHLYVSELYSTK